MRTTGSSRNYLQQVTLRNELTIGLRVDCSMGYPVHISIQSIVKLLPSTRHLESVRETIRPRCLKLLSVRYLFMIKIIHEMLIWKGWGNFQTEQRADVYLHIINTRSAAQCFGVFPGQDRTTGASKGECSALLSPLEKKARK